MLGLGIMLSLICITVGITIFFNVKRTLWRMLCILGFPFIIVVGFYLYMAILSGSFDEYAVWSALIIGMGTALGTVMTALGVFLGLVFSRL